MYISSIDLSPISSWEWISWKCRCYDKSIVPNLRMACTPWCTLWWVGFVLQSFHMVKTYPLQLLFAKTVSQCHAERHIGTLLLEGLISEWYQYNKYKRVEHGAASRYLQPGHALGIWICGCSLFYKRELWASKSEGANSTKSLKISGCKRWCPKDVRVPAPAAPVITHSLYGIFLFLF